MILPILLAGLFFVPSSLGDCVEDAGKDGNYMNCVLTFSSFISSQMDASDPNSIISIMCSDEAKMKMSCLMKYLQQCPQLMSAAGEDNSQMASTFQMIGNLDSMCAMVNGGSGGSGSGKCAGVQQCMAPIEEAMGSGSQPSRGDMGSGSAPQTPFTHLQRMIAEVCGSFHSYQVVYRWKRLENRKDVFSDMSHGRIGLEWNEIFQTVDFAPIAEALKCLEGYKEECPETMQMIDNLFMAGSSSPSSPSTATIKMYMDKECPKVPSSFGENACVKEQLMDQEFIGCFEKVGQLDTSNDDGKCQQAKAGKECIEMYVGKCGKQYADTFVKSAHIFIAAPPPSNCPLYSENNGQIGIMSSVFVSIAALLISFMLALF